MKTWFFLACTSEFDSQVSRAEWSGKHKNAKHVKNLGNIYLILCVRSIVAFENIFGWLVYLTK
jgi:hypothetical protein